MNNLYNEYLKIEPNIKILYITPSIESDTNDYLKLLYSEIIKKIPHKSLKNIDYPLLCLKKIKNEKSIVHHHWFETRSEKGILITLWKLFWLFIYKLLGGKIIWTIHNKFPHDKKFFYFNKISRIIMAHISTKLHVHCENAISIMSITLKVSQNKFFIEKHPDYEITIYSKEIAYKQFKNRYPNINIDKNNKIFLVFGQMAQYKGIEELLQIITTIDKNYTLILAGKVRDGNLEYINRVRKFQNNKNILFIDEFIPDEFIPVLFNLSDCVLFNYLEILTSGAVVLSLNYEKDTIAPNKACIANIMNEKLFKFSNQSELLKLIKDKINVK